MKKPIVMLVVMVVAATVSGYQPDRATTSHTVDIRVERNDGSFVSNVTPSDLALVINATQRAIETVEVVEEPVSLVLLIDFSLSAVGRLDRARPVRGDPTNGVGITSLVLGLRRTFTRELLTGDRARVGWFAGSTVRLSERFTSDPAELDAAITRVLVPESVAPEDAMGPSPAMDAVAKVAALLEAEPGRRAIVLITDGESSGNRLSVGEAGMAAALRGVTIFVMVEVGEGNDNRIRYPPNFDFDRIVSQLATLTGGMTLRDDRHTRLSWGLNVPAPPLARLFDSIHKRHRLRFSMDGPVNGATVDVKAADPKLKIHAARWLPRSAPLIQGLSPQAASPQAVR